MKKDNKKIAYNSNVFDSLHQQKWIEHIIKNEVYCLDNQVVNHLLNEEEILYDDIINLYNNYGDNAEPQEIFQYFRVSEWLAESLSKLDEPIILSDEFNASWWGRTTFGQSLEMDYIWKELYNSIFSDEDIKNHNQEEKAYLTQDNKIKELKHQIRNMNEIIGGQKTQLKRYEEFSKSLHNHNDKNLLQNLEQIAEFMRSDLYYVEFDEDHANSENEHYILCDAIEKAINIVRGLK